MAMKKTVEKSSNQHENIIFQLQNGQLQKATELLAENNLVGMEALINWLKSGSK
jgi:hypothetical protein